MNELKTVTAVVKDVLTKYSRTRSCDGLLYLMVLEHYAYEKGINLQRMSVPMFLQQMDKMGFPGHETVRRTRQKLQATYPELSACKAVEGFRAQNEKEFRAYARSEV